MRDPVTAPGPALEKGRFMSRLVCGPLVLHEPKAEPHRQSISYDRVAAAGISWTSQAQMLDEVYTIGGYFIAQKAALGHGKFRQWVEGSLGPALSYRTVRLYMLLYCERKRAEELLELGCSVPPCDSLRPALAPRVGGCDRIGDRWRVRYSAAGWQGGRAPRD